MKSQINRDGLERMTLNLQLFDYQYIINQKELSKMLNSSFKNNQIFSS